MKDSLLWELNKDGYCKSYLFGTMHVKSKQVFSKVDFIKELILGASVFAAEYDLDELKSSQQGGDFLIPDGGSMLTLLGERKYTRVRKSLKKAFNLDINPYQHFLPMLLVNLIGESILSQEYNLPLDVYLWEYAKKEESDVVGIETYESQVNVMRTIRVKDQLKMVKELARNTSKFRKGILKMAAYYEQEDIKALYKYGKKTLGRYKSLLLTNRNRVMASRFEEMSCDDVVFFAVGAGHLAGADGVLRILKSKGWKLKAI